MKHNRTCYLAGVFPLQRTHSLATSWLLLATFWLLLGPDYPQVIGSNHRWTILDGTLGRKAWLLLLRVYAATVLYAHIKCKIFFEIRDI